MARGLRVRMAAAAGADVADVAGDVVWPESSSLTPRLRARPMKL